MSKGVSSCVIVGSKEIGREMASNPIVRQLTFTGSTEVGKLLMEQCAGTVEKLALELCGNEPFIVFGDADIEAAAKADRLEIPECRPDLRLRQLQSGAGRRLRCLHQAPRRDRRRDECCRRQSRSSP
jgi:hypothetical protein